MELGLGGSVVVTLLARLPENIPFKIYADLYFSSLKLVNQLQKAGVGYNGTINPNRVEKYRLSSKLDVRQRTARGTYT